MDSYATTDNCWGGIENVSIILIILLEKWISVILSKPCPSIVAKWLRISKVGKD